MSIVNPNTLTTTRIPSAYISTTSTTNPGGTDQVLRKIANDGTRSKIVIGPRKEHQYIKGENWRSGLTPGNPGVGAAGDNGYFNDGISAGYGASDAPSRYYNSTNPSIFDWWSKYVIYCHGGNTTGPNGNDNLEIFVANDTTELISLTNKLLSISVGDEVGALAAIGNSSEILCVNAHYPNIPISDSVGVNGATYSLKLLHDFGFTPCYPRGGLTSYDISNNISHNMEFTSSSDIIYEPATITALNCLGGCLKMTNDTSLAYAYIPYDATATFYSQSTTVNTWVRVNTVNTNKCIIDTTAGWVSGPGTGYQLFISGSQVTLVVLTSVNVFTWSSNPGTISAGTWYNITFTISSNPSSNNTEVNVIVSDNSTFSIASDFGTAPGIQVPNTNDFVIGVKNGTPKSSPFHSNISLVSVYDGVLSKFGDIQKLWSAYAQLTFKQDTNPGAGRYAAY